MSEPDPDRSPSGPVYRGRPLPRPDDDVVDQGLGFDVITLLSRRRVLGLLGLAGVGAGGLALAGCTADAGSPMPGPTPSSTGGPTEIPDETAGPFPADGSNGVDVLEQSGIVRRDLRSSFGTSTTTAQGVPLTIELTVLDLTRGGAPFGGVAVYVWHCDRDGNYSLYSTGVENENYLRGVQISDDDGSVIFTSIVPACYPGRWPHVHFEIYPDLDSITDSTTAIATSQLALPEQTVRSVYATDGYQESVTNLARLSLAGDSVFGDDSAAHQLGTVSGDVTAGYRATLEVPVDTRTRPGGGSRGPGGPATPGGGFGRPPGTPPPR